jgi:hypothetical protein
VSAQTTMMAPTVKILYIAAHSRSGSTLLDRMLGQISGYFSLGEVRHLWQRGIVEGQRCGCGAPFQECPFWTAVLTSAFGDMDLARGATMARQLRDVGHLWHIGRLRHARRSGTPDTEALASVTRTLADLYAGLQRTADSRVLVDSSKSPGYAYLLSLVPGLQLHIVHLVRDGRGVAYSRLRRKQRGELRDRSEALLVTRTAIEWAAVNGLSSSLRDSVPYSLIKYEEMIEDPAGVLRQITARCGDPDPDLSFMQDHRVHLGPSHTVSGNEMRFAQGWIALTPDDAWRRSLQRRHRWVLNSITWPWMRRYGYL